MLLQYCNIFDKVAISLQQCCLTSILLSLYVIIVIKLSKDDVQTYTYPTSPTLNIKNIKTSRGCKCKGKS